MNKLISKYVAIFSLILYAFYLYALITKNLDVTIAIGSFMTGILAGISIIELAK